MVGSREPVLAGHRPRHASLSGRDNHCTRQSLDDSATDGRQAQTASEQVVCKQFNETRTDSRAGKVDDGGTTVCPRASH